MSIPFEDLFILSILSYSFVASENLELKTAKKRLTRKNAPIRIKGVQNSHIQNVIVYCNYFYYSVQPSKVIA